jgi:hypothetical protein
LTDTELANKVALDAVSIAYFPPKKYPTGTLTFEHTFPENGKFIGIVTVENDHGQKFVSQFPFAVGVGFEKMGITDFLLDYENLIGSSVEVRGGILQTVGGVILLRLRPDLTSAFATIDISRLARDQRKAILNCAAFCRVTVKGIVRQGFMGAGIQAISLDVEP